VSEVEEPDRPDEKPATEGFSAAAFRARARPLLRPEAPRYHEPPGGGDHALDKGPPLVETDTPREAAVLIPVVDRGDEATVLLTVRTDHLPSHAGQIAFPGGKIDDTDEGAVAAALREADEEIGLGAGWIEPIGFLDAYISTTGFRIIPVVSVVRPGFTLTVNEGEVADVFEVPLGFLMDAANHRQESAILRGSRRIFLAMPYGERYIWGVTAGILKQLYETVYR